MNVVFFSPNRSKHNFQQQSALGFQSLQLRAVQSWSTGLQNRIFLEPWVPSATWVLFGLEVMRRLSTAVWNLGCCGAVSWNPGRSVEPEVLSGVWNFGCCPGEQRAVCLESRVYSCLELLDSAHRA